MPSTAFTAHDLPELLTVAEAAELLRCTPRSIYNYVSDGRLPAVRLCNRRGHPIRIPSHELKAVLYAPATPTGGR